MKRNRNIKGKTKPYFPYTPKTLGKLSNFSGPQEAGLAVGAMVALVKYPSRTLERSQGGHTHASRALLQQEDIGTPLHTTDKESASPGDSSVRLRQRDEKQNSM